VLAEKAVVPDQLAAGFRGAESRVESHRGASVGGQLGEGDSDARRFILAQRVGVVVEGAPAVTGPPRALSQHTRTHGSKPCRSPCAVPEITLAPAPHVGGKEAPLVAADRVEVARVVPRGCDQVGLEGAAEIEEDVVKGLLDRGRGETEHLPPQWSRFLRIV